MITKVCWILLVFHPFCSQSFIPASNQRGVGLQRVNWGRATSFYNSERKATSDSDTQIELTERTVRLRKPLGIVIEEADDPSLDDDTSLSSSSDGCQPDDMSGGVIIKSIDPNGSTSAACLDDNVDIAIRDKILAVNGISCKNDTFESIMDLLIESPPEVEILLGRPSDAVLVRWSNGINVAAKAGDYFGQIAQDEAFVKIPYSCSNGGCGTCEQTVIIDNKEPRYLRPCIARVPKSKIITVNPSDRYEPSS
eukprot:516087_1